MIDAAIDCEVTKIIAILTDKASNPSKLIWSNKDGF